jgi:two-component system, response regulator / RNA-binding antiterminator
MTSIGIPSFRAWTAIVLHRPHAATDAVLRQLERIGVSGRPVWPALDATAATANVVFFDADLGHDDQFPWTPGAAPMPLVAILGSEAPGRVEWAIRQGADAHLLKPIGSAGVYSALVIAQHAFAARHDLVAERDDMQERLRRRPAVAQAVIAIMHGERLDERAAYRRLREIAMETRRTIEDAADAIAAKSGRSDDARDSA